MDPSTLVKKDYELVRTMLSERESTTERVQNERRDTFDTLKRALSAREIAGEGELYPVVSANANRSADSGAQE
jgi:hypothetical protein